MYQSKWDGWCRANGRDKSQRTNEAARRYGQALQAVGSDLNCDVLDVWDLLGGDKQEGEYGRYLTDGVHLNDVGNRMVYNGLMGLVSRIYPDLAPMVEDSVTLDGKEQPPDCEKTGIPMEDKPWTELC